MKVTAFILLAFCLHVSASTLAQQVTLSEHKAPLEKVINDIKQQTGYSFFYNEDWLKQSQPVDIDVKNARLDEALKICFANQPYSYAIVNKTIVLKLKENTTDVPSPAPVPFTITGKVTDTLGTPLIGATVSNNNTKVSTITDEKGEFVLKAEAGNTISISYLGFTNMFFTVTPEMPYRTFALHPKSNKLTEVVINTGYQNLPAERATGSFAQVDSALFNRRVSGDVISRLEGVVPGLLVNRNVYNGAGSNQLDISIRGTSTLFSNAQPLIVVDNFPYDGNISNINPNDIASITVLKDAAAASIWGVQSGNGVIVITTKKGRRNQPMNIETNANVTIGARPNVFYSPDFLDSKDFIGVEQSLFNQGYYDAALNSTTHAPISPVVQILANERAGTLSAADATAQINTFQNNDNRNDIEKYYYRNSVDQQYSANFRGGGLKNDYIFSIGYDNNLDNLVGNNNNRLTFSTENNFYPLKNLTVSFNLSYVQTSNQTNNQLSNLNTGRGISLYPYEMLADAYGNPLPIVKDYNYSWITNPTAQTGLLNWQYVPLNDFSTSNNSVNGTDNRIVTGLRYAIIPGLTADLKYQYENASTKSQLYYSQDSYYARNLINLFTDLTGSNRLGSVNPVPIGGILQDGNSNLISNRLRGQLNYAKDWRNNSLTVIIGSEIDQNVTSSDLPATIYGYDNNTGTYTNVDYTQYYKESVINNYSRVPNQEGFGKLTDKYISYFSNAAYTYLNRYTLSASVRIDKSNLFGVSTNQKAVPLYSFGAKWDIDKEPFYHINWLPMLTFRSTFGYNGNLNKSATAVTTIQQLSSNDVYGIPYDQISSAGNPELRWEKDRMINFGLDFGFKDNSVTGSVEYYIKNGSDLFANIALPPSTGITYFFGNVAAMRGNGMDVQLNFKILYRSDFKWSANFIASHAIDVVTKYSSPFGTNVNAFLSANATGTSISPIVGKPLFAIYSYKWGGLTHDTGDPQGYINGQPSTDYANIIKNTTVNDLVFNGSARPTYFGSLRNNFSYGPISVSANIIYKLDYFFERSSINYLGLFQYGTGNIDFNKRWTKPGDELITNVPSMPLGPTYDPNRDAFYSHSSVLVDKGDHIRLEDISVTYTFSKLRWMGIFSNLQVYSYINNVGIIWRANHDHLDPDVYNGTLPLPRTISLGIKTNF